jgi:AcrR family transcriptional regulator
MVTRMAYHHGDLRRALLAAAVSAIEESGPTALSLRDLARRAGVSHAAPAHHFGDKAGLLTALAADGYRLLDEALRAGDNLLDRGVAYVRFAVDHRAHFEVMFRPELYRPDDPEVVAAGRRAAQALRSGVAALPTPPTGRRAELSALAAWSIVHGFATLWLGGALPSTLGEDPGVAARDVIRLLFEP